VAGGRVDAFHGRLARPQGNQNKPATGENEMPRNVVGLDIGTTAVRAAELSIRGGHVVLVRIGQVSLPPGAVVDGEVMDPVAVATAIRALRRRAKLGAKRVVLGVSNQRVVVRQVDLPWMPPDELRRSLTFQAQDHLPIPIESVELDFNVLAELEGQGGQRMLRILLVAAKKDMIASHLAAVSRAGLSPVSIDLNPFALLRSLAPATALSDGAEALVDIGARVTNVVVHQDGAPRFVRILLMGGQDITDALRSRLSLEPEDAELAKLASSAGSADDPAVADVIDTELATVVEEVRGSLDFYAVQPDAVRPERVTISGGGSLPGQLAERLQAALQVPVERARPLASVRVGRLGLEPEQLAELEPLSAVPVGLALGSVA
jgi:type IV pilus assembly protein PilM